MANARDVALPTAHYPPAEITPAEFEQFVVALLESVDPMVDALDVTLHDKVQGVDGLYDFDATVRFDLGGMRFSSSLRRNGIAIRSSENSCRFCTTGCEASEPRRQR